MACVLQACRVSTGVHASICSPAQSAARRSLRFPGRCLPAASRFAAQAAATAEAPTEQSFEYQAEVRLPYQQMTSMSLKAPWSPEAEY